jgi:predicted type IV restriction endonuclease
MSVEDINRLPHLAPVRFVTEVLVADEKKSACVVEFEEEPTLAAIVEAAAQNVIFIASLYRDFDGGVLTAMKKVKLLKPLIKGSYKVESSISAKLDNFSMFKFSLSRESEVFVEGEMSIVMKARVVKLKLKS